MARHRFAAAWSAAPENLCRRLLGRLLILVLSLPVGAAAFAAQRIVSLDLCTDWMLARYGERAHIAALSPMHRRYPVAWLPANWPYHDGTLEQILALKPDLVITGQYNALLLRGRLQTLGVRVEVLSLPTNLAQVTEYEERFLTLIGNPAGHASVPPAATRTSSDRKRLLLLGANGVGTGRNTFENAVLEHAGWGNYLREEGHIRLDLEQIATDPPDAILWAAPASRALANRFAEHPALRRGIAPEHWLSTDYWRWQCPGPWTWDLIGQLTQWID